MGCIPFHKFIIATLATIDLYLIVSSLKIQRLGLVHFIDYRKKDEKKKDDDHIPVQLVSLDELIAYYNITCLKRINILKLFEKLSFVPTFRTNWSWRSLF